MAFFRSLLGGGKRKPDYTGLQIQSAINVLPIPIGWGEFKVAPNVLWYNGFQIKNATGKGAGLFSAGDQYDYFASLILGLCEGPIQSINRIWKDQAIYTILDLEFTLFDGAVPQTAWSFVTETYPAQALGYQGTAYVCNSDYDLGNAATISNHNFEVVGYLYGTGVNGIDADPSLVIFDYLTNPQYGVGFPVSSIYGPGLFTPQVFAEDGSTGLHVIQQIIASQPSGTVIEFSVDVQARERSACALEVYIGGTLQGCDFNLATGAVNLYGGATAGRITVTGDGWCQLSIAVTMAETAIPVLYVIAEHPYLTQSYAGTVGSGMLVGGGYWSVAGVPTWITWSVDEGATLALNTAGDTSLQTYCLAAGLCFSPALINQETASSILDRWVKVLNCEAVWTGGRLKFVPRGDVAVVAGTLQQVTQQRQIAPPSAPADTKSPSNEDDAPATIYVCPSSLFVADGGVIYSANGEALTYIGAGYPSGTKEYGINPPGTYLFRYLDEGSVVSINYTTKTAGAFNPNLTPVYSLDDDDYLGTGKEDPLTVSVTDPYTAYNIWELDISARDNAYNQTPIFARDQDSIEKFGNRLAGAFQALEVCDENVGAISAQLMLQKAVYIRQTYTWKSSWELCLLDPMDLVEITDADLNLNAAVVRITDVDENDDGTLTFTAEEFPGTTGAAPLYQVSGGKPIVINRNATAAPVNPPIIFEPPDALGGGLQIWAAVSGSDMTNYGGCFLWVSLDGDTYTQQGQLGGYNFSSRTGALLSSVPAIATNATGQTVDTQDTLAVDLTQSAGDLASGSSTAMTGLQTLCYLGTGEYISYQNAMLTAEYQYALSPMVRGAYDSTIAAAAAGTTFARLDNNIITLPYLANQVGTTIFLKFQAYNPFGGGIEDLADVSAYAYPITGLALASPLPNATNIRTVFASGFMQIWWDEITDFRTVSYEIRQGSSWTTGQTLGVQAHPPFVAFGPGDYWVSPRATPANGLLVYSDVPLSIDIAGNMLVENLVITDDEAGAGWPGTLAPGMSTSGTVPNEILLFIPQT
jgi:hypothetical protein